MRRRLTPSEALGSGRDEHETPPEPQPAPPPARLSPAGAARELDRLDNRALGTLAIAVLMLGTLPGFGFFLGAPGRAGPLHILQLLFVVLALACTAGGALVAWQALRLRPLESADPQAASAHARDAVEDKRDGVARAAGMLVAALVLGMVGAALAYAVLVADGGFP